MLVSGEDYAVVFFNIFECGYDYRGFVFEVIEFIVFYVLVLYIVFDLEFLGLIVWFLSSWFGYIGIITLVVSLFIILTLFECICGC